MKIATRYSKLVAPLLAAAAVFAAAAPAHAVNLDVRRLIGDLNMYSNSTTNKTVIKLKYTSGETQQCGNTFSLRASESPQYNEMVSMLIAARLAGEPVYLKWNVDLANGECVVYSIFL